MLGKLLKYEIKATARILLPMYIAVLLFGIINRFLNPFNVLEISKSFNVQAALSMLSIFIYFAIIVAVLVMTLVIMIQRFYKSLLGDEGYLMFTLPVKPWQHIVCKLLVSMMWNILSLLSVLASVLILANVNNLFGEISNIIRMISNEAGNMGLLLIPIYLLAATTYSIMTIYDSITVGHLFIKHKILASFGAYMVFDIITQTILGIFMLLFAAANTNMFTNAAAPAASQIAAFAIIIICLVILLTAGHFILANTILKKKLNLE